MTKTLTLVKASGILCLVLFCFSASAQSTKDSTGLKIGLNYLSNDVFYGRSDTVKTPTIIPLIKYTFDSGIYLSADLNYVTNRVKNKVDGGSFALGYLFDVGENGEGGLSIAKYFYNANSTQVSSANRANFNGNFSYNVADIITPFVYLDYTFNRSGVGNDTFTNFGLTHDFEFEGLFAADDNLRISPSVELNAGSQNFYDDYIVGRATRNKKIATAQATILAAEKAELSQFKLLDYELSLPIFYQVGHVIVNFTPSLAFAQNKLPATISSALSGSGQLFYLQTGISYRF